MHESTGSQRDAASTIFNLPNYRVIDAVDLPPDGGRRVVIASTVPPGCPSCGVLATKVHSRRSQQVRDVPVAGAAVVVWAKRRWFCLERPVPGARSPRPPSRSRDTHARRPDCGTRSSLP